MGIEHANPLLGGVSNRRDELIHSTRMPSRQTIFSTLTAHIWLNVCPSGQCLQANPTRLTITRRIWERVGKRLISVELEFEIGIGIEIEICN